jgi:hypothetical protein
MAAAASPASAVTCNPSINYVPNAPSRCEQWRYARETMMLSYPKFLARKANFAQPGPVGSSCSNPWPNTSIGCRKPFPYNYFDWTTDGCSPPTPDQWKPVFAGPCEQHDFGFRNFGNGMRLQHTESRRVWINKRFLGEMRRVCSGYQGSDNALCNNAANFIFSGVMVGSHW